MIELRDVSFEYDARPVLRQVSANLAEHRIGLVGANGSGKSTLARLCHGLLLPTAGQVLVNGHDTRRDAAAARSQVGFVFQDPDIQIIMPTVAEDLAFSLRPSGLSKQEISAQVDDWLGRYDLVSHRDHPAHLLSGGQKQLLAIAAVLITQPQIVIFDEPTTLLDLRNKHRIMAVIAALDQQVVMVSHDLDLLSEFDRILVVDAGQIIADDSPRAALDVYRRAALG
ncbi:MAG: energy-coupling factor ABC transporter ATP-binding protein [Propionibacteriaceae bacterium]|jgi:biotin transport system ATP-binding protein|nr:energy-coupling factor ABC transporter ATP-binding protein [Propionibacteriaceae bacterium]